MILHTQVQIVVELGIVLNMYHIYIQVIKKNYTYGYINYVISTFNKFISS